MLKTNFEIFYGGKKHTMTENKIKRQFIKTYYIKDKNTPDKMDKIFLVYKTETGEKRHIVVETPKLSFYTTKKEFWKGQAVNYISKDKVDAHSCVYKYRYKEILKALDDPKLTMKVNQLMSSGIGEDYRTAIKLIDVHGRLHSSDINLEDQYIYHHLKRAPYEENFVNTHKAFFDIEVDSTEIDGFPEPEEAEAPVNMITYVDDLHKIAKSYILKYDTDTYREAMTDMDKFKSWLDNKYNVEKKLDFKFEIIECDSELELITKFLYDVNEVFQPDFICAWNMDFDFPTLYNRLIKLGQDPNILFSGNSMEYKNAYYKLDRKATDPADRYSLFMTNSYVTWLDQLATYANVNKPKGRLESYSLDFIANMELGEGKSDFDGEILNAHNVNYGKFLKYNIQDTMLLYMIENKVKHLDLINLMANMTRTRPTHVMKKTISLRNFGMVFYEDNGFIMSNNKSKTFPKMEGQIPGGFVGDPNLVDNVGIDTIIGKSKFIHDDVTDIDYGALYPTLTEIYNISPETHAGLIKYITPEGEDKTELFIDAYNSNDAISFGIEYMNMPTIEELLEKLDKVEV